MTYSRRNSVDEQQEACQKARQITAICGQFHITLDPIDWQQFGMWAPVKVNNIEIASLLDLGQRESEDILRQVQIKLFARAALETLHSRLCHKALMWTPVDVVQPQAFLSLWIITLETDERIPIIESIRNGQRVYEHYQFDGDDGQLAKLDLTGHRAGSADRSRSQEEKDAGRRRRQPPHDPPPAQVRTTEKVAPWSCARCSFSRRSGQLGALTTTAEGGSANSGV